MADAEDRNGQPTAREETQRLSTRRLFLIVVLFLALAAYSIWTSDRFQTLLNGVSQARLSALLERPVTFRRVQFQIFPPSLRLADVRVGNDPRLPEGPLLEAEEVSIGGGVSITENRLRFGKVRAVRARLSLVQFPDGTWNLPPGLARPAQQGGLEVQVGEILVQQGVFVLDGREMGVNARMEDFAAILMTAPRDRYRGTLVCRRVRLELPGKEPLDFALDLRFRFNAARGFLAENLKATGAFGELTASGGIEDLRQPVVLVTVSGELHIAEVERVLRSSLGFQGDARVRAEIRVPPGGDFRITGRVTSRAIDAKGFPLQDVEATVLARPESLVARIDKARYSGGEAAGTFRLENLVARGRDQPMTLALQGRGIWLERFFGDLKLPGTGLSGAASLEVALRWGAAGIERADGGGTLQIAPGPATSLVPGRFGIPTGGGGALAVVDGRIGFEGVVFQFPATTLEMTGGIRIGKWAPDFDFRIRSRNLTEFDRIFQNFVAAGGSRPEPLGLGGTGEAEGHIAKSWAEPDVSIQFATEETRYADVLFGSVRATAEMRDGAFLFHPLRAYDGEATLSLEGTVRYRRDPAHRTIDATLTAREFPLSRLLAFLDLDYPIEGKLSGSFPLSGDPPAAISGGGTVEVADAVVWGQRVGRMTGRATLEPGRLELDDVRAEVAGGAAGGRAALAWREKTFEVRAAGDGIALTALDAARELAEELTGSLSFELQGSGSFEKPDFQGWATLTGASLFGNPLPPDREPRLELRVEDGILDGSVAVAGHWTASARGDLFARPARIDVALEAPDLAALLLFTRARLPAGGGGALVLHGTVTLPAARDQDLAAELTVTKARLDLPERPGIVETAGDVGVSVAGGTVRLRPFRATGPEVDLRLEGSIDLRGEAAGLSARLEGKADASLLSLVVPDPGLTGELLLDVVVGGTTAKPTLIGTVRLENGRYRVAGFALDDIEGSLRLLGEGGELEALRAKVGGGDAFAAGTFHLAGTALRDFRFTIQGRRVATRYLPDLRLTVDADLVVAGGPDGNQVRGEVTLLRGTYSRDFDLAISALLAKSRPGSVVIAEEPWKAKTFLDVRIVSAASLEVRNNLARLSATVELEARGTLAEPVLLGQILVDEGARVIFQDVRYEIESGTVTFASTTGTTPIFDVQARADVKGYELRVGLTGTWPRIQASFSSDPPLSDDQILGLLLGGAAPSTRGSTDAGSAIVSAAGGVVAGALTGGVTRRTGQIFGLDRFQIDPVFTGGTISTVRSTLGKRITPDLSVTYSQTLDSSQNQIVLIEWLATNTIIVQGLRDENGNYSISFRKRQRLGW